MKKVYELVVGDWSFDGHNQIDKVIVEVKSELPLEEAYDKAVKILGFDLIKEYCYEYEDRTIPEHIWNSLIGEENPDSEDGNAEVWGSKEWSELYLNFCKAADPTMTWKYPKMSQVTIGGYGLFSN